MISSIGISVSGMQAASTRLANSANNVANIHSTSRRENGAVVDEPYEPQDVVQSSIEPQGGVEAHLRPRDPASITMPDVTGEVVEYPNVNLEEEIVGQEVATYDYKANLKALKAADEMIQSLLDITS